ncbi:hypothetical protein ABIB06_007820, partial [Bradyrhizobium sp. LB8.2]|uniref:hypothetical protein n=1 Tax=unclassified Bradyrhizobium TaxID=2631580 RepID=UPI0033962EF1
LESVFNPHASSHGLSGAELIRLPLNALMSNQKDNCNARPSIAFGTMRRRHLGSQERFDRFRTHRHVGLNLRSRQAKARE